MKTYTNGSPADRGQADSYCRRPRNPHWYPFGTATDVRYEEWDMNERQIKEYHTAFDQNEEDGWFKYLADHDWVYL